MNCSLSWNTIAGHRLAMEKCILNAMAANLNHKVKEFLMLCPYTMVVAIDHHAESPGGKVLGGLGYGDSYFLHDDGLEVIGTATQMEQQTLWRICQYRQS